MRDKGFSQRPSSSGRQTSRKGKKVPLELKLTGVGLKLCDFFIMCNGAITEAFTVIQKGCEKGKERDDCLALLSLVHKFLLENSEMLGVQCHLETNGTYAVDLIDEDSPSQACDTSIKETSQNAVETALEKSPEPKRNFTPPRKLTPYTPKINGKLNNSNKKSASPVLKSPVKAVGSIEDTSTQRKTRQSTANDSVKTRSVTSKQKTSLTNKGKAAFLSHTLPAKKTSNKRKLVDKPETSPMNVSAPVPGPAKKRKLHSPAVWIENLHQNYQFKV